jgi:hypothetical protein
MKFMNYHVMTTNLKSRGTPGAPFWMVIWRIVPFEMRTSFKIAYVVYGCAECQPIPVRNQFDAYEHDPELW